MGRRLILGGEEETGCRLRVLVMVGSPTRSGEVGVGLARHLKGVEEGPAN
jgi:hypothetical protein